MWLGEILRIALVVSAQEKCQTAFCPVTEKRVMQNEASDVMQGTSKPMLEQLLSLDA